MFIESGMKAGELNLFLGTEIMNRREAKEILMKAASLVEERGHCKFRPTDGKGRVCTMFAIMYQSHTETSRELAIQTFMRSIGASGHYEICAWNNLPEITQEDVATQLRKAALSL